MKVKNMGLTRNKRKLKIAMIAPYPASIILPEEFLKKRERRKKEIPHQPTWIRALCKALYATDKTEIKVFTHSPEINAIHRVNKDGINYIFIPKYEPRSLDPYHLFLPAILQMTSHIKKFDPDIVHGFGTESAYGIVTAYQCKPKVLFIQGIVDKLSPYSHLPKIKTSIKRVLEAHVIKRIKGFITENKFAAEWVKQKRPEAKIGIIPHCYTDSFLSMSPKYKNKRIISVGTLSNTKGCDTVIDSFYLGIKRSPEIFFDAELFFIGDGPKNNELKERTKEYGINDKVHFIGRVSHEKIPGYMENANVLVIGSRMDTSPNVITEAHSIGIPVVGTATGGIPEMIHNKKDGFIVNVNDSEEMSKRIEILLEDKQICSTMGKNGRNKIQKLNNPKHIANKHLEFYKEMINCLA